MQPSGAIVANVPEGTEGNDRGKARNEALTKVWARDEALTKFCLWPALALGSGAPGADQLVNADCAHEADHKGDETQKAPGPTHVLFDDGEHDDGDEEDGGHFIPNTQLL